MAFRYPFRSKLPPITLQSYLDHQPKYKPDESARKARRNLSVCLLAMIFVVTYDASLSGGSAWGFAFDAKDVPLEYGIIVLSWLFFLNWLQPIVIDYRAFRLDWKETSERFKLEITGKTTAVEAAMQDHVMETLSIEQAVALADAPDADADDFTTQQQQTIAKTVRDRTGEKKRAQSTIRRRRFTHYYNLITAHVLPVSTIIICPLVWWYSTEGRQDITATDGFDPTKPYWMLVDPQVGPGGGCDSYSIPPLPEGPGGG